MIIMIFKINRGAAVLLICLLPFWLPSAAGAADKDENDNNGKKVVRVGYYLFDSYEEITPLGEYRGYGYDYYKQIQKYTNWEYEFITASFQDCVQMLSRGEIDIMAGTSYKQERLPNIIHSENSIGEVNKKLFARADDEAMDYGDYQAFDNVVIGVLHNSYSDYLEAYFKEHNLKLRLREYAAVDDMEQALANGEVRLIYVASVKHRERVKIVQIFQSQPIYYAVNASKPELLAEVDEVLWKIAVDNPNFSSELTDKYINRKGEQAIAFTKAELDYIKSKPTVNVILNSDWAPLSYRDRATGEFKGIFLDVFELIGNYSGLNFVYYTGDDFNKAAAENPKMLENVVAIMVDDNAWADIHKVYMSNQIMNAPIVRVGSKNTAVGENTRIAMVKGFYITWRLEQQFKPEQIIYYDTIEECLDAVANGDADFTYVNDAVAKYYLSMLQYSKLFTFAGSDLIENMAAAVYREGNPVLLGIINKSLLYISENELNKIMSRNAVAKENFSLKKLYYAYPFQVLGAVIIIFIYIFSMIYLNMRKRQLANALADELKLNQSKNDFMSMMSHEIRTPLNAIIGYLRLAGENVDTTAKASEYIIQANKAARQLLAIAQDILDVHEISSREIVIQPEIFEISRELKDTLAAARLHMAEQKITADLQIDISAMRPCLVNADKMRLNQVLLNLLTSASKFAPSSGMIFFKASLNKIDNSAILNIEMFDTGIGIPEPLLSHIRQPFSPNEFAFFSQYGGIGMIIYITRCLVNLMDGRLDIIDRPDGTMCCIFEIELQLADSEAVLKEYDFSSLRAISAFSDTIVSGNMKQSLKSLGVKCDSINDGAKLLKRFRARAASEYAYQLCILESSLCQPELISQLKTEAVPPVIVVVADTDEALAASGADAVIQSPVDLSELAAALASCNRSATAEVEFIESSYSGINVLVVEDNDTNAYILQIILQKLGMEVTWCQNGQLGYEAFVNSTPDFYQLILMDLQMPVLNGFDATIKIRKSDHVQAASIPIIAISANALKCDIEKALLSGMNEHLAKPLNVKKLSEIIGKYCTVE